MAGSPSFSHSVADYFIFYISTLFSCLPSSLTLMPFLSFFFFFNLTVLGLCCDMQDLPVSHRIFRYGAQTLWSRHTSSVVAVHEFSCSKACGILVPLPGIEPTTPALYAFPLAAPRFFFFFPFFLPSSIWPLFSSGSFVLSPHWSSPGHGGMKDSTKRSMGGIGHRA